jgi:putative membrane protein
MILPGVSGAFILLILGAYQTAIDTINNLIEGVTTGNMTLFKDAFFKFSLLAIGAVIGLKVFSKALNWMFKHQKNLTLAILTGFMIGSLNKIWPWKEILKTRINSKGEEVTLLDKSILPTAYDGDNQLVMALIFIVIGFATILILESLGKQKNKV